MGCSRERVDSRSTVRDARARSVVDVVLMARGDRGCQSWVESSGSRGKMPSSVARSGREKAWVLDSKANGRRLSPAKGPLEKKGDGLAAPQKPVHRVWRRRRDGAGVPRSWSKDAAGTVVVEGVCCEGARKTTRLFEAVTVWRLVRGKRRRKGGSRHGTIRG
jgi:hypothetical protein